VKTAAVQQNSRKPRDLLLSDTRSAQYFFHSSPETAKPHQKNSLHHCCFRWM